MNRDLDGYYFRVFRDGNWESICWSDTTEKEKNEILKNKSNDWLREFCKGLGCVIRDIGDELDLIRST